MLNHLNSNLNYHYSNMSKIARYISQSCISYIRDSICDADGNEVFFIGKTNSSKIVSKVKVVARGNEFAVPVVQQLTEPGDVVLHNHPSGVSEPSQADIQITRRLVDALALVDIRVLDHVIVGERSLCFSERGLI